MRFYKILQAKQCGNAEGLTAYERQFVEYLKKIDIKTITGVLPLTFTAKGGNAADWVIYGNDDVGENLINVADITIPANVADERGIKYLFWNLYLDAGTYTICCYQENTLTSNTRNTLSVIFPDNTRDYESISTNFHLDSGWHTLTFTLAQAGAVSAYAWGHTLSNDCVYTSCMLVKGSTAPDHYIPYQQGVGEQRVDGYYVPLTISQVGQLDKNYDIYIGDTPLTEGQQVSKTSTGQDIELFKGENVVSTTLYNKPSAEIKYK